MNKLQFLLAGYLPYFSLSQWSFGWYSPYGCVILPTTLEGKENCYHIFHTTKGRKENMVVHSVTSISHLQKHEDLLIGINKFLQE